MNGEKLTLIELTCVQPMAEFQLDFLIYDPIFTLDIFLICSDSYTRCFVFVMGFFEKTQIFPSIL